MTARLQQIAARLRATQWSTDPTVIHVDFRRGHTAASTTPKATTETLLRLQWLEQAGGYVRDGWVTSTEIEPALQINQTRLDQLRTAGTIDAAIHRHYQTGPRRFTWPTRP